MKNKYTIYKAAVAAATILLFGLIILLFKQNKPEQTVYYPVQGFSNMCAYNGKVYCGVNGLYGEPISKQSSIFTIWEDKLYYVEKVQEAYDSMTDELLSVWCSDLDGSNAKRLADNVFLAGAGHEKLAGNKLFYGYGYDENYRMKYAYVDLNTGVTEEIKSDRINEIVGYDGNYLYYNGFDSKLGQNIIGRIYLKGNKDDTVAVYAETDEEGYIDKICYLNGKLYCFTLTKKTEGYDYRTYEYRLQVRSGKSGKVEREIPVIFTGSANYSFMVQDEVIYATLNGAIISISLEGEEETKVIASMKPDEYWGILYFAPGDGYLYFEAIGEVNQKTGNNDYFYRVPLEGGENELLKEWFTV